MLFNPRQINLESLETYLESRFGGYWSTDTDSVTDTSIRCYSNSGDIIEVSAFDLFDGTAYLKFKIIERVTV